MTPKRSDYHSKRRFWQKLIATFKDSPETQSFESDDSEPDNASKVQSFESDQNKNEVVEAESRHQFSESEENLTKQQAALRLKRKLNMAILIVIVLIAAVLIILFYL